MKFPWIWTAIYNDLARFSAHLEGPENRSTQKFALKMRLIDSEANWFSAVCRVLSCVSQEWAFPQCSTALCFSMTGQTDDTHKSWTSFCSDTLKRHTHTHTARSWANDDELPMSNSQTNCPKSPKHQWKVLRQTSWLHLTDQYGYFKKYLLYQAKMPKQKTDSIGKISGQFMK